MSTHCRVAGFSTQHRGVEQSAIDLVNTVDKLHECRVKEIPDTPQHASGLRIPQRGGLAQGVGRVGGGAAESLERVGIRDLGGPPRLHSSHSMVSE